MRSNYYNLCVRENGLVTSLGDGSLSSRSGQWVEDGASRVAPLPLTSTSSCMPAVSSTFAMIPLWTTTVTMIIKADFRLHSVKTECVKCWPMITVCVLILQHPCKQRPRICSLLKDIFNPAFLFFHEAQDDGVCLRFLELLITKSSR